MLQAEVIHKLDLIAFEGWEYHKLPLENWEDCWSNPVGGNLESLATTSPVTSKQPRVNPVQLNEGYNLLSLTE
jgi:hypothetical protein